MSKNGQPGFTVRFLGQNLKSLRETAGLSQSALARKAGIKPNSVSRYEAGTVIPSADVARKLAAALGVSVGELLGEAPQPSTRIPLDGFVQAGYPADGQRESGEVLDLATLFPPEGVSALRVQGRSMEGMAILSGDWVVVRFQPSANSGELVVAVENEGLVVKKLICRPDGERWLHSFDKKTKPRMLVPERGDRVVGVLLGVIRKM